MDPRKALRIPLLALALAGLGGLSAFNCPTDPAATLLSVVHLTSKPIPIRYFHDHSTAQIEAMRHMFFHSNMMHNPGLTQAEHGLKTNFKLQGLQHGRNGPICVWVESVDIDFSWRRMDVYISSQYGRGSCPYQVILDHENQHVAINTRTFEKYRALMLQALRGATDIPTKAAPLVVQSLQGGKALITQRIDRAVMPLYEAFQRELLAENAKIDTLENYRRTQARCAQW